MEKNIYICEERAKQNKLNKANINGIDDRIFYKYFHEEIKLIHQLNAVNYTILRTTQNCSTNLSCGKKIIYMNDSFE